MVVDSFALNQQGPIGSYLCRDKVRPEQKRDMPNSILAVNTRLKTAKPPGLEALAHNTLTVCIFYERLCEYKHNQLITKEFYNKIFKS